jgi:serine/threonine protein kinase
MEGAMEPTQPLPEKLAVLTVEELAPHFPQLQILECLGRGGMGVVYKARQKSLNRLVALKLLAPERVGDALFAARFEKEAHALAALNHPNIVAIYDFGETGGYWYLLMEYVDGVSLREVLLTKRLTPKEALSIVPTLCDALQCAHERGIVHRDIKPENLLMDKSGVVKVADFGIAKILEDTVSPHTGGKETNMMGTPDYAAPEQTEGNADHRADIYSLGVVLYEMLTGTRPNDGDVVIPPSKCVQVDIRIDEVVLRALEKKPEMRFSTAAEFRSGVESAVAGSKHPAINSRPNQKITVWSDTATLISCGVIMGILLLGVAILRVGVLEAVIGLSLLAWGLWKWGPQSVKRLRRTQMLVIMGVIFLGILFVRIIMPKLVQLTSIEQLSMTKLETVRGNGNSAVMQTERDVVGYILFCSGTLAANFSAEPRGETGDLRLNNRTHFSFSRNVYQPSSLKLNGQTFSLILGRVFVLNEDGSIKQHPLFPKAGQAHDLAGLALQLK